MANENNETPSVISIVDKRTSANPATQPESVQAAQHPPAITYTVPIQVPGDLMNQLIAVSNETGKSLSDVGLMLMQQAINIQNLSEGTISDLSESAQEVIKSASLEAVLEALRIYNVSKMPVTEGDEKASTLSSGDIVFNTTSDVKDIIVQINANRTVKGLAPLEKSICEILYYYGVSLGDYNLCEKVTGIPLAKYKAVLKTLALNEREANGAQSNIIEGGSLFGSFSIVETPEAANPVDASNTVAA